jgi:iron complex outermembrane receptor protein
MSRLELLNRSFRWKTLFLVFALCLVSPATQAQQEEKTPAEEKPVVIEEVTVTARQQEEALEEVPATVSVLTDAQLEAAGVARAEDFVKLLPAVSLVNTAEVGDTQVNIRGINGSRDAENSFALIVDGVLMTNPAAFNREYFGLSQLEVLKGPQGAYYGRNAAAGAIIVTTSKPGDSFEGLFRLSAAEDDTWFGGVTIGGPFAASSPHRFQLHGDWRTSDGFYANVFQSRDDIVDDFEAYNVGARLSFQPNDQTAWDLKARIGEVDAASITFNAAFALPAFATVLGVPQFFEDVNDHQFIFQPNIDPQNDQDALELSGRLDRMLGTWGELNAWLLYSDIDNAFYADGTSGAFGFFNAEPTCIGTTAALFGAGVTLPPPQILGPTPAFSIFGPYTPTSCDGTQYQVRTQDDLSFQVRLSGDAGDRLRWQTGVYYLDIDREVGVNLGIDLGEGVVEELFVPQAGANPTEQLVDDNFKTEVFAVFGAFDYDLSDDFTLSLAARYDREERDVINLVPTDARTQYVDYTLDGQFLGGAPLNPGLDPNINPSGMIAPKNETFDEVQPKISFNWRSSDALSLYGSWGVGFKSGGFNNQGSNATVEIFYNDLLGTDLLIEDQFDKETSNAIEIGFKSRPSRRFSFDLAAYHVDVDDMQFFEFLVGPFGLLRVVSNIEEVEIDGAEFQLQWLPARALRLYAGYNVTDSEIKRNSSRPATVGNTSPATPDYTGNLGLDFSQPLSDRLNFTSGVYLRAVGETWFHTVQDETRVTLFNAVFPGLGVADYQLTQRDSFALLDLRIGVASEHWSLTAFATNVSDEEYLEEVIVAPEFGGSFIHPGSLRRIGVEIGYRF